MEWWYVLIAGIVGTIVSTAALVMRQFKKREREKETLEVTELVKADIAKRDALIEQQRAKEKAALEQRRHEQEAERDRLKKNPTREDIERILRESKE